MEPLTTLLALEIAAARRNLVVERWQTDHPKAGKRDWISLGTRERTLLMHMDLTPGACLTKLGEALALSANAARGFPGDLQPDDVPLVLAAAGLQPYREKLYLGEVLRERS
jgi:hypothetical protein